MRSVFRLVTAAVIAVAPLVFLVGSAHAAAGDPLDISPNPVVAGSVATISGSGCAEVVRETSRSGTVLLEIGGASTAVEVQSDGSWSVSFTPASSGTYDVNATCDLYTSSFSYDPGTLTVEPEVVISSTPDSSSPPVSSSSPTPPTSTSATTATIDLPGQSDPAVLRQGQSFQVAGAGFAAGEQVDVVLHSTPIVLATFLADDRGAVSGTVTIPLATPLGRHTIDLGGESSDRTASAAVFVIAADETTTSAGSTSAGSTSAQSTAVKSTTGTTTSTDGGAALADTGVDAPGMGALSLSLAGAGSLILVIGRRRPSGRHH